VSKKVDITLVARAALGIPNEPHGDGHGSNAAPKAVATIREWYRPRGVVNWTIFGSVALLFTGHALIAAGQVEPGTTVWAALDKILPLRLGPAAFRDFVPRASWVILGCHVLELVWLDRSRLAKHGISRGSLLWWKWMLCPVIDGVFSFQRFDRAVREAEKKQL
jgi:hypothetical protein